MRDDDIAIRARHELERDALRLATRPRLEFHWSCGSLELHQLIHQEGGRVDSQDEMNLSLLECSPEIRSSILLCLFFNRKARPAWTSSSSSLSS
jgi:hypothetical protein